MATPGQKVTGNELSNPQPPSRSGGTPLTFKLTDAATAEAVRKFVQKPVPFPPVQAEVPSEPPEEEVTPLAFGPATEFDNPNAAMAMSSGLIDIRLAAEISDEEKLIYLKALLADQPFKLDVLLFKGALRVTLRTRTMAEQQRINDLVFHEFSLDSKEQISPQDMSLCAKRTNQYLMMLMVQSVNGISFTGPDLVAGTLEEAHTMAMRFATDKLETLHVTKMTALTNAIRIFESKSARLASEAANESFWQPRS